MAKMLEITKKLMLDYLSDYNIDREQFYFQYSLGLKESIMHQINSFAKEHGFKRIKWMEAGAMISTHAGPGGVAIAGLEV